MKPDVLGVDWKLDILKVRDLVPDDICLQGNLQPEIIAFNPDYAIDQFVHWAKAMPSNYIMNLGHGVLPFVPEANVQKIVAGVKARLG